ncbi:uncharacterized protein BJX67DRAFT_98737 [Aspergillus lucknowensis]|uniref:DUF3824 domain-containing protein n=1 Tax=Aspergillus lucknowensis TaxID=176173 RepID=A0ABR4M663_9EURO
MAYYDSPPHYHQDRYPPAAYPESPHYYGPNTYSGSHQPTDVVAQPNPSGGTRDAYYRNHPARDSYKYGYDDHRQSRRSRKKKHRAHSASGHYDDPYEYEPRSRPSKHYDERRGREKYGYSPSTSRSPPRRRRSMSERALGALGLGAASAGGSKHHDSGRGRSRDRVRRSYSYSPSPPRGSRHHRGKSEQQIAQAVKAALAAGAVEAFRARKEPGDWSGPKGKRVLTAALAAGGTDGIVDRNPDKHSKRHILESTLAGLATNRVINGSRSHSRSHRRSRSQGRSTTKDAALLGLLATAGKKAYDQYQDRRRSTSRGSYEDDYDSRPRRSKKRSKSVSEYINEGMAALGLGEKGERDEKDDRRRRRHREHRSSPYDDDYSDDSRYSDDDYYRRHQSPPRARHSRDVSRPYYTPAAGARVNGGYGHTIDERKRHKKLNRETLWATGLAAATTTHAAHSLNEHMEKHRGRAEQLKDGEIIPDEARHNRKNQLSDLANVGIAALGNQSAVNGWKNFDEKRRERAKCHKQCKERSKYLTYGHPKPRPHPHGTQSLDYGRSRTVYPDEIEENWSDVRPRSTAGSSGVMV